MQNVNFYFYPHIDFVEYKTPPELNPIEKFWANLKRFITKIINKFHKLSHAIDYAWKCKANS